MLLLSDHKHNLRIYCLVRLKQTGYIAGNVHWLMLFAIISILLRLLSTMIFFLITGTSVDLTSTLLDMFDTIVAKNTSTQENGTSAPQQRTAPPPCDPGGGLGNGQQNAPKHIPTLSVTTTGGRPARAYSKRSYSDTTFNVSNLEYRLLLDFTNRGRVFSQ